MFTTLIKFTAEQIVLTRCTARDASKYLSTCIMNNKLRSSERVLLDMTRGAIKDELTFQANKAAATNPYNDQFSKEGESIGLVSGYKKRNTPELDNIEVTDPGKLAEDDYEVVSNSHFA